MPATVTHADSAGEEHVVSVPEVSKVMEVMKAMMDDVVKVMEVGDVVVWKHRGMMASPSAGHVWAVHTARAVHAAHHRMGRHHWRGKHRHHDSASNRYFAEHDNPPDCHSPAPY